MTPAADPRLEKLRALCLALPETKETLTWDHPVFRVGEKMFAIFGFDGKKPVVTFKTDKLLQEQLVESDPRFCVAAYVGQHGWVTMDLSGRVKWSEVADFLKNSYLLIAPKRLGKLVAA